MDKRKALQEIMKILSRTEGDIESVLEDYGQHKYDEGYNQGVSDSKT